MQSEKFLKWLIDEMNYQENTARSRLSNCERICKYCGDIDIHYEKDKCLSLIRSFNYTAYDESINHPPYHQVPISGNIRNGTATLKQALILYIRYLTWDGTSVENKCNKPLIIDLKQKNIETKDSYSEFLQYFQIEKEQFYTYGLSSIIFAPIDITEKLWRVTKSKLLNNQKLLIRSYGRQGKNSELFLELYKYIFNNNKIEIDPTNNSIPRKVIQESTGYKINNNLFNYQCSHIWGKTKNPLLFESAWNICFVPRIFDPLTGHECKGDWNIEFSKLLREKAYKDFYNIIEDYNKFVIEKDIMSKINKFADSLDRDVRDDFLKDALSEWEYIGV